MPLDQNNESVNLIDPAGVDMAVVPGAAIPPGTQVLLSGGTDGANARVNLTDASGRQITVGAGTAGTPAGGVLSVQGTIGGTPLPVSGTFAPTDTTAGPSALGALNATIQIALAGQTGAGFQLDVGTLVGTIVPEVSLDGGTTWVTTQFNSPSVGGSTNPNTSQIVFTSANTAQTRSIAVADGASHARVRVSAYTSGTANATLRATQAQGVQRIVGAAADLDSSANVNPVLIAGNQGGNFVRAIAVNNFGYLTVTGPGFAGGPSGGILTVQGDSAGTPVPVSLRSSATTVTSVAVTIVSTTLQAANTARRGLAIFNGSTNRTLYVKLGSGASLTDYTVQIPQSSYYEVPFGYTGIVTGRWNNTGAGTAQMTEFT